MFFKAAIIVSLALLAVVAASNEAGEDVNHQKAPAEKKFLMAPLIAGALLKPAVVLPMVKPAMIGAAAGAVSGNLVANLNKQQDVEEDRTISVTITCGEMMGYPCYLLPTGCYCPIPVQKSWSQAFSICQSAGKRLLSIESASKQIEMQLYMPNILSSHAIYNNIGFWTSGAYCVTSFTWTARPQYFTYTNWFSNSEPTITGLPNGACVRAVPSSSYRWDDIDCGQYLPFVCEP